MKEINVLWVDSEHPESWDGHISVLEHRGFKFRRMSDAIEDNLLDKCEDEDMVIIHTGTSYTVVEIKAMLLRIRSRFPKIKIGLDTNAISPILEDITDFYIEKPMTFEKLEIRLREIL
jgi:hypothetical protein